MISVVDTGVARSNAPVNATVRAGETVYLVSISKDPATGAPIKGSIDLEMRQALENLKQAMKSAGGTLADVAQVIVYLVDSSDFVRMNDLYREFFAEPYPSRATVVVKELIGGLRVELVAYAHLSARG